MKPLTVKFKDGETLKGTGKFKNQILKFKADEDSKAQNFDFRKIYSVEIEEDNDKVTYRFFQTEPGGTFLKVKPSVSGKKAELFTQSYTSSTGPMLGFGSMPISMTMNSEITVYYVRKPNEERLTELGTHASLHYNFKKRVLSYFSDCESLIEKLNTKELKARYDVKEIVEYYNKNCE